MYKCTICCTDFQKASYLKKHEKTKGHLEKERNGQGQRKKYTCEDCNYSTDVKRDYLSHNISARHLAKKEPEPEKEYTSYLCSPCGVLSRDKANYSRHLGTKRHSAMADASVDLPEEKLRHVIEDLVLYFTGNRPPFEERVLENKRFLRPKQIFVPTGNTEDFLCWMKLVLDDVAHRFEERENGCWFTWPNHKYTLSRRDFAKLIICTTSDIFEKRISLTRKKVEQHKETQCTRHGEYFKNTCSDCTLPVLFDVSNKQIQETREELARHRKNIFETTMEARLFSMAYWKWWSHDSGSNRKNSLTETELTVENFVMEATTAETMDEKTFLSFLGKFTYKKARRGNKSVRTVSFLDSVALYVKSESKKGGTPAEKQSRALFCMSFCARLYLIRENIFLSHFGFERIKAASQSVIDQVA